MFLKNEKHVSSKLIYHVFSSCPFMSSHTSTFTTDIHVSFQCLKPARSSVFVNSIRMQNGEF